MKKLLLISCCTFSVGAWATEQWKHAPIPDIKGKLDYDEKYRSKVLKSGWKPIPVSKEEQDSMFYDKKIPERTCGAPACYYHYQDKYNNTLFIYAGDIIADVTLKCKK